MNTEDYVSFEMAKLLKEKGFDWNTYAYYEDEDNPNISLRSSKAINWNKTEFISKPTLQMVTKWLREVHKLDIDVSIEYKNSKKVYYYSVLKKTIIRDIDCLHSETNFDSYEEACEASIRYCLENLV